MHEYTAEQIRALPAGQELDIAVEAIVFAYSFRAGLLLPYSTTWASMGEVVWRMQGEHQLFLQLKYDYDFKREWECWFWPAGEWDEYTQLGIAVTAPHAVAIAACLAVLAKGEAKCT